MSDSSDAVPRLVVGVGASAGGLDAFRRLLDALPADTGMAFVLVQHLSPSHASRLTGLLAPGTSMSVHDAEHGLRLEPDSVYVIPPDTRLAVRGERIELSEPALHRGVRLPVDHLFNSLAQEHGPRSVGIVLSGAGSDGSAGVRAIRMAGGLVIAQDPGTVGQSGMPRSAIDSGVVDLVLPIEEMPSALERFDNLSRQARYAPAAVEDPTTERERAARLRTLSEEDIGRLADALDRGLGFNLRVYKPATIERRVLRRVALAGFQDSDAYIGHVVATPGEQQQLMRDMLISVTEFFRDPEAFRELRDKVLDPLVTGSHEGDALRIWVPGCATGEEAYSVGIEALDAMAAQDKRLGVQIFATDIDRDALAVGRAGAYPVAIADRMSEERLRAYFEPVDGKGFRVCPELRDIVSFAAHDLTRDPPFSKMDLVSCRNVLIYLTTEAQKDALQVLHFALEPQGHLLTSTSESTGARQELFATVSKTHRIYQKLGVSGPVGPTHSRTRDRPMPDKGTRGLATARGTTPGLVSGGDLARRAVLDALAPPTLVVSANGTVVFSHGELGPYVRIPEGEHPRFDLGSVLRPEIATRVRGALYKCRRSGERVSVLTSPDAGRVRVEARPAPSLGDDTVILTFEEIQDEEAPAAAPGREGAGNDAVLDQLERELQATRDDLRSTVEELEISNEELRSSNEESMSMNEELQAANEELEATSEELRSLNEELTTVNAQLRDKVEELEDAHDDLGNFFASTRIATLFLDNQLRIKRFTPVARDILGIEQADVGRSVRDIARELLQDGLAGEATDTLADLSPRSRELQSQDGRWFSRQLLPYRTESQHIEGVVVTFVDITETRTAAERVALREHQQRVVAQLGLRALRHADIQGFMQEVAREVRETLDVDFSKIVELQPGEDRLLLRAGEGWVEGRVGSATEPAGSGSPGGFALHAREPVVTESMATEIRFSVPPLFEEHGITSGIACVVGDDEYRYGVIGVYSKQHRRFMPEDVDFVQAVAHVVGSAIGRYQARLRLDLELAVAHELADQVAQEETLDAVLQAMASEVGPFAVAELWWPAGDLLFRRALQVAPDTKRRGVERHFSGESFPLGKGVVGQIFEEGRAVWITDLGGPRHFTRPEGAAALGLVSGFGLPVRAGGRTIGVVTLLSSERLFADDTYLRSLETIGRSIGDFVARSDMDEAARELAAITSSSHDAIFAYGLDGIVTRWLPGAEDLYGYAAEEMVGGPIERIVPEELRGELGSVLEGVPRGEVPEPFETTRIGKDGTRIAVSVRSSPVEGGRGESVGISSTHRDISHLKETERRLVTADRQKDEFIAMLGHELRNPLGVIRTAAELLKLRGGDSDAIQRTQSMIERQSEHMSKLLDGLLDVSRIISGKIRIEREVIDVVDVCRAVSADFAEQQATGSREVRTDFPSEPIWVDGDRVRLTQVMGNLLSNAVKFAGENGIATVSVRAEDGAAVVRVTDTGIGIEADLLPHIFEVFRQSDQNLDRSDGGLGLGLALVKSLVELHGGHVEARSEGHGKGAEFLVTLPLTTKAPRARPGTTAGNGAWTALIIDDNADFGEMLKDLLEAAGHRATVATRGRQGLEMAREDPPDVVLCDLGLPGGMTGFDVATRMRDDPRTRDVPLVAVSGYGRPEDKERSVQAGFDAHLTKPVDLAAVTRVLSQIG